MVLSCPFTVINFIVLAIAIVNGSGAVEVEISQQTFDELTEGKTVFLKLYAPWCGHCKELAPHWKRMAKEWVNNKDVLVASVDCTLNEEFCLKLGIQGFPTLLFGDPSEEGIFLEPYNGDKKYEDLSKFANATLSRPICSPANPSLCDGPEKEKIVKMRSLSISDLDSVIQQKELSIEQAEKDFEKAFGAMQAQYDQYSQEHELRVAEMKKNIKLLQSLLKNN